MTRPTTEEWLASTIPASLQGRYLGRRFQLISALALATILVTAWLGDWARNQADSAGLAAILCVGAAFGLASVFPLTYARLPMVSSMAAVTWRDLPGLARVRDFRNYVLAILLYHLPFIIATPFYFVFMLEVLNLSMAQAALMQAPYQLTKILACRTLGPTMNRIGPRRMMQLAAPIYVVFFIMFALSADLGAWLAFLAWFLVGWADGMWNLASPSLLYRSVPPIASRQAFFAAFNFCVLGLFAVGGVVGVSLLKTLDTLDLQIAGWTPRPLTVHYLVSAALMVFALLAGSILPNPRRTRPPSTGGANRTSAAAPPDGPPDQGAASA